MYEEDPIDMAEMEVNSDYNNSPRQHFNRSSLNSNKNATLAPLPEFKIKEVAATRILAKWNNQFVSNFSSREASIEMMNKGTSFLVAPHNVTYDKRSINATERNHSRVQTTLEDFLDKFRAK